MPALAEAPGTPEAERSRGRDLAEKLSIPVLARIWQMLLKGIGETRQAPFPLQAAEMVLVRLAYAGELPTPGDLVKRLQGTPSDTPAKAPAPSSQEGPGPAGPSASNLDPEPVELIGEPEATPSPGDYAGTGAQAMLGVDAETLAAMPASFAEVGTWPAAARKASWPATWQATYIWSSSSPGGSSSGRASGRRKTWPGGSVNFFWRPRASVG